MAQSYNGYTLYAYDQLEDSLLRGDIVISRKLLTSINFENLTLPVNELSFYVRKLYTATDRFNQLPTLNQDLEVRRAYRSQFSPQQLTAADMGISNAQMIALFRAAFGDHPNNQDLPANFSDEMTNRLDANTAAITALTNVNNNRPIGKVIDIPLFHGNDDEDPDEWVQLFEQAHQANGWSNGDARKIALAAGHFRDAARDWYLRLPANVNAY